MASGGKKKTTMAKLNRESKLRERRLDKQARKDARRYAATQEPVAAVDPLTGEPREPGVAQDGAEDAVPALADA